ncbi:Uncharacterised protein [Burkholderia cenocepacia]|nr:Uncharacterised protein [Burkholderia cenocepacia]
MTRRRFDRTGLAPDRGPGNARQRHLPLARQTNDEADGPCHPGRRVRRSAGVRGGSEQQQAKAGGTTRTAAGRIAIAGFSVLSRRAERLCGIHRHISMQQTVNDDLVEHDADWQFSRIGFAKGFLRTVLRRADRSPNAPGIFRMERVSEDDAMTIEWIARMQTDGIDNASPSTSNVKSIVDGMASDIASTGPRRSTFGSRAGVDGREGMERDEISSERLRELTKLMRDAERRRVAGGPCPDRAAGIERSRDGRRRSVGWRTFRCRSSVPPGVSDIAFQGPDCRARP